jgi:hypothetical protein
MLKNKLFASAFALAFVIGGASIASAAYTFPDKIDTKQEKMNVQTVLNMSGASLTVDGVFGPKSVAAVKAFQSSKGLDADGVIGPMTRAALEAASAGTTTGSTSTTTSTSLKGGAGDSSYSTYSTGVKSSIKDGEEGVKVAGLKIEAIDSDISVNSIKVNLEADGTASTKVSKYIESVDVYMGSTKVASEDVSDFTKDGTDYYKSIALSKAVVKADSKEVFYVVFNAVSDIDDANDGDDIKVDILSYRFTDGDGVTTTREISYTEKGINLDLVGLNDVSLKSSTANPKDATITVDEDNSTEDVLALAFKIDVDEDSVSDASIVELPVVLTFASNASSTGTKWAETVVESVVVKIDGDEYEAEYLSTLDTTTTTHGGTATYTADIDGATVVDAGDVAEVKVYVTFAERNSTYSENMTVKASVGDGTDFVVEDDEEEVIDVTGGTKSGATLTLSASPALITELKTTASKDSDSVIGTYTFSFNLEADGSDITLNEAAFDMDVIGGSNATSTFSIIKDEGDVKSGFTAGSSYTVEDGNDATFTVTYTLDPLTAGTYYITLNEIAGINVDKTSSGLSLKAN